MYRGKKLARLIIPLVIEQLFSITVGMADIIMVSAAGDAAVSGVSLVDSINVLIINIFSALATGGAVVVSQFIGMGDKKRGCLSANQLVISTLALSVVVMILCEIFNKPLLSLIFGDVESEVMESAVVYFAVMAASYPFIALYNSGAALFRSMGNSKISMETSLVMNILNIGGNALFIYVFRMGAGGVALSSLISRIVAAIVIMRLIGDPKLDVHTENIIKGGLDFTLIKNILRIGVPNGLENSMFQLGKILVQRIVTMFGTVGIAANSVAGTVCNIGCIPGMSIGMAMITIIGQRVGAGDYDGAEKDIKYLTKLCYIMIIITETMILLTLDPILSLYSVSPEALSTAKTIIIWHSSLSMIFWPPAFSLPNALRAAHDVKYTMWVSVISMWLCRIGLAYVFAVTLDCGVIGVWYAMFCDWVVRAILIVIRTVSGKWKNKQFLTKEEQQ